MEKSAAFKELIRTSLIPDLKEKGYRKVFDNTEILSKGSEQWIFKLVFEGPHIIEISNDDWRDYTEYFNLYVNSSRIHSLNINLYADLSQAYEFLKHILESKIDM